MKEIICDVLAKGAIILLVLLFIATTIAACVAPFILTYLAYMKWGVDAIFITIGIFAFIILIIDMAETNNSIAIIE